MNKYRLQSTRLGSVLLRLVSMTAVLMVGVAIGYLVGKPYALVRMGRIQRPPAKGVLQLVEDMKAQGGLYSQDDARMVEWYLENLGMTCRAGLSERNQVHLEKLALAVQLVSNLEHEYTVKLPTQVGENWTGASDLGKSHTILRRSGEPRLVLREAVSRALWQMARAEPKSPAERIFPLLELVRPELSPPYVSERTGWTYLDVLAYLRIYVRYQDTPFIREYVSEMVMNYNWPRDILMLRTEKDFVAKVLNEADQEGPEAAASLYMRRLGHNMRNIYGYTGDVNQPGKPYHVEATWEGWPGESLTGILTIKDANAPSPVIGLKHVRKVVEVAVNDVRVLNWSLDLSTHMLTVPIPSGEKAMVHVKVDVLPEYWEATMSPLRDYP
jgi:hypothetical protein